MGRNGVEKLREDRDKPCPTCKVDTGVRCVVVRSAKGRIRGDVLGYDHDTRLTRRKQEPGRARLAIDRRRNEVIDVGLARGDRVFQLLGGPLAITEDMIYLRMLRLGMDRAG